MSAQGRGGCDKERLGLRLVKFSASFHIQSGKLQLTLTSSLFYIRSHSPYHISAKHTIYFYPVNDNGITILDDESIGHSCILGIENK